MKDYLDEMIHLTADIAEQLLEIKDTGGNINPTLCGRINRLAELANGNSAASSYDYCEPEPDCSYVDESSGDQLIENVTDEIMQNNISELREEVSEAGSSQSDDDKNDTTQTYGDAEIEAAREEAMALENDAEQETTEPYPGYFDADSHAFSEDNPETAEAPQESHPATENTASETPDEIIDSGVTDEGEIAESAEFEETEDADVNGVDAEMLRRAFTLNDLFLYRRTLFGGSAQRFNEALQAIAGLREMTEIKKYLSEVEHINLRSDEAKEFVSVLNQFFPY